MLLDSCQGAGESAHVLGNTLDLGAHFAEALFERGDAPHALLENDEACIVLSATPLQGVDPAGGAGLQACHSLAEGCHTALNSRHGEV